MRFATLPVLGLLAALAAPAAHAAVPPVVDFETPASFESIGAHYDSLGLQFGPDLLALRNDALGPYFDNAPSPIGVMFAAGSDPAGTSINVASGFTTGLILWASSTSAVTQAVQIYDGQNGTGNLLASLDLSENAQAGGCSSAPYCHFDKYSVGFAGTAYSVTFANAYGAAAFDNLTVGAVPEPSALICMALGLATLTLVRRRG